MIKNVLEYLEITAEKYPDKAAFDDDREVITFQQLKKEAFSIGTRLTRCSLNDGPTRPIVVFLPKSCKCISAFLGIAASGNFYCPIADDMPVDRINMILDILKPMAIITNEKFLKKVENFHYSTEIVLFDEAIQEKIDQKKINTIKDNSIDTDPLYVLFTSGSTGVPKGVVISHRSVIDYIEWVAETFSITSEDTFGNQAPFYFDNSILDIYSCLKTGASAVIIPKKKLMFPGDLIPYLDEKRITAIFWVPSMLCNVANLKVLDSKQPHYLKKILFAGEVMPNKQLNIWRKTLPNALYANLYGPTEITDVCAYYIVNREFEDDDILPIGFPCRNTRIIALDEQDNLVKNEKEGELCVIGSSLARGYYNNTDKTQEVFVQNPLNSFYRELIYRTGDIVRYNEFGELIYLGRKDFQIKHMGHRIELGEIEAAFSGLDGVENCACIYDEEKSKIKMCYTGNQELGMIEINSYLMQKIPSYMMPAECIYYETLPYNANGKIDRKALMTQQMKRE